MVPKPRCILFLNNSGPFHTLAVLTPLFPPKCRPFFPGPIEFFFFFFFCAVRPALGTSATPPTVGAFFSQWVFFSSPARRIFHTASPSSLFAAEIIFAIPPLIKALIGVLLRRYILGIVEKHSSGRRSSCLCLGGNFDQRVSFLSGPGTFPPPTGNWSLPTLTGWPSGFSFAFLFPHEQPTLFVERHILSWTLVASPS